MCDCDYRDDSDDYRSRGDLIRDLVEFCDSIGELREIVRDMRAEFKRQRALANSMSLQEWINRRAAQSLVSDGWVRPKTAEELRVELAEAEYRERIEARGPNTMSPAEVRLMAVDDFRRKHGGPFKGEA